MVTSSLLAYNACMYPLRYRAPELLLGSRHYTTAVDVWAVGCIFAEVGCRGRRASPASGSELTPRHVDCAADVQPAAVVPRLRGGW